jgi:Phosphoglucomutase/phosphomannomutase, alpha/beta/alpha domain I
MSTHPNAGKPAPKDILIDVSRLEAAFYEGKPDPADQNQLVSFGTSGHRGTSSNATFTEAHILAITQAICENRRSHRITEGGSEGLHYYVRLFVTEQVSLLDNRRGLFGYHFLPSRCSGLDLS